MSRSLWPACERVVDISIADRRRRQAKHPFLSQFNQRCHNSPVQYNVVVNDDGTHSIIHSILCPREGSMINKVLKIGTSIHGLLTDFLFSQALIDFVSTIEKSAENISSVVSLHSKRRENTFAIWIKWTHTHLSAHDKLCSCLALFDFNADSRVLIWSRRARKSMEDHGRQKKKWRSFFVFSLFYCSKSICRALLRHSFHEPWSGMSTRCFQRWHGNAHLLRRLVLEHLSPSVLLRCEKRS